MTGGGGRGTGLLSFLEAFLDTGPGPEASPRRTFALALVLPPFVALQVVHWLALRLDRLLFPGYRAVEVREPLFVVGLPRSGTTFLHRVLADDEDRFTTLRLWELLLAPAVVERKALLALAWLDRILGRPGARILSWLESRLLASMRTVHPTSLRHPEEDYLFLLPVFAAFILVLAFPGHPRLWAVSRLDLADDDLRRGLMTFYRGCLQRHLYVVGTERRILSKNPSFTPFIRTLAEAFPDARFIGCVRDPRKVVASQLSSLQDGAAFFGWAVAEPAWRDRIVDMLAFYGEQLVEALPALGEDRYAYAVLSRLSADPDGEVRSYYRRFGWTPAGDFPARLMDASRRSQRRRRSSHRYRLEDYGLTTEEIEARFAQVMDRFGFQTSGTSDA